MIRFLALFALWLTFSNPAHAYIDAGLGSLLLQSFIAGFFTFMVVFRGWMSKVKSFFGKKDGAVLESEKAE
jgi:formate hydrogenlyase subunit 3/multisubunit Na+/H+ antiporter MnhD subunit